MMTARKWAVRFCMEALPFGGTVISRRELFAGPSTMWPHLCSNPSLPLRC